jgi:hypothetical protein
MFELGFYDDLWSRHGLGVDSFGGPKAQFFAYFLTSSNNAPTQLRGIAR